MLVVCIVVAGTFGPIVYALVQGPNANPQTVRHMALVPVLTCMAFVVGVVMWAFA